MTSVMHVACQANARFAPDCGVMLHSLLSANPDEHVAVHFLHDDALPPNELASLQRVVRELGAAWEPILLDNQLIDRFPVMERYGGVTAWFRLLLPRLLPELPRVLYLDADLLIVAPLRDLWRLDLGGHALAAATQPVIGADRRRVVEQLGLPDPERYFNSGVMLLDLDRLRSRDLMARAERIARERVVPTPWADQEPLNVALWSERLDLDPRWNVMNPLFELPARLLPWPAEQVSAATEQPAVIHFIGPYKPWHYRLRHPYSASYFEHLAQTPWGNRKREGRSARNAVLRTLPPYVALRYEMAEHTILRAPRSLPLRGMEVARRAAARHPRVHGALRAAHRLVRHNAAPAITDLLDALADSLTNVYFVQIGANDATHGDPLRRYVKERPWRGVLVEPVPYVFARLQARYGDNDRIELVNAAVSPTQEPLPFYYVSHSDDPGLPEWYDQIGSFSLDNVLHPYHVEQIPNLAERVVQAEVRCVTFERLWEEHGLPRLDVLHIDAEGYDDEILAHVDLERLRPMLILYEHQHLAPARRRAVLERLRANRYRVIDLGPDAAAVRDDAPLRVRLALLRHRERRLI